MYLQVRTDTTYILPTLQRCGMRTRNDTEQQAVHVTNLAVLSHFFSQQDLGELASDTFLRHPITADMPPFTLYNHNYSSDVAAVKKTQLALSKAVNLTLARKTVYRLMAEYLSHRPRQQEDDISDPLFWTIPSSTTSPLVIASIILSSIALIFSLLLGAKLRAVSLLLSVRHTSAIPTHLIVSTTLQLPR